PSSYSCSLLLRPLRSTVVTRFAATMGLSDSRSGPLPRLCFPSGRWRRLRRHPAGSPRFLGRSVSTRRPLSPRQAQRLLAPITSSLAAGFIKTLRRTGRLRLGVTRPKRVRFRYSSQIRLPRPRQIGLLRSALGWLSIEWAIDRMNSFQFIRSTRLSLALRRHRENKILYVSVSLWLKIKARELVLYPNGFS